MAVSENNTKVEPECDGKSLSNEKSEKIYGDDEELQTVTTLGAGQSYGMPLWRRMLQQR